MKTLKIYFIQLIFLSLIVPEALFSQSPQWEYVVSSIDEGNEYARSITTLPNGDIFIAGEFSNTLTFQGNTINTIPGTVISSAYFAKFNSNGDFVWSFAIGGDSSFVSVIRDLDADSEGNCYLGGKIISQGTELIVGDSLLTLPQGVVNQTFIIKVSSEGEFEWITYLDPISESGILSEIFFLEVSSNDDLYVSGQIQGTYYFGSQFINTNNLYSGFLAKMDRNTGEFIWVNTLGSNDSYNFSDVISTNDGRIFISGEWAGDTLFAGNQFLVNDMPLVGDNYDAFVVSYSDNGEVQFMERHHSPNNDFGGVFSQDSDNNVYLHYTIDQSLNANGVVTNGPGFLRYEYIADAPAQLSWIIPDLDYIQSTNLGDYDSQGNFFYGGTFDTESIQIGEFSFNNSGGASGTRDIYLFSVNNNGEVSWATTLGGTETEFLYKIHVDENDKVKVCGSFISSSLSIGSFNLLNTGKFTDNLFIASLNNPLSINNIDDSADLSIYPNPAQDRITILLNINNKQPVTIKLIDLAGKEIKTEYTTNKRQLNLDISEIPNGVYIIQVKSETQTFNSKIIIQN